MNDAFRQAPFIRQLESCSEEEEYDKPHKQINQYLIIKTLGEGSFAKVYLAQDTNTKKKFALKRFKLKELQHIESGVSQLEREISVIKRISHPNIIKLHEVLHDEEGDVVYLVEDFADCGSLFNIIDDMAEEKRKMDMSMIKHIFKNVLKGVAYLHSRGIVHQDIKPSNILVSSDASVFLADFGVGHSFQSTAMVVGSPAYQAPEALTDEWTDSEPPNPAQEDVWSLGIALYQTVFGKLPFKGENVYEIVQNINHTNLEIPEKTDKQLEVLIRGMLSVDPNKRLTVDDILNSEFFRSAKELDHIEIVNKEILQYNTKINNIDYIQAVVCGTNISFARQSLTHENLLRGYRAPPATIIRSGSPTKYANVLMGVVNKCLNFQ